MTKQYRQWFVILIEIEEKHHEFLNDWLLENGSSGIEYDDNFLKAYFEIEAWNKSKLDGLFDTNLEETKLYHMYIKCN